MNAKRVYRLYREEGLQVRTAKRKKRSARVRVPLAEQRVGISAGAWTS